jgi:GGDEF domain-containing protein
MYYRRRSWAPGAFLEPALLPVRHEGAHTKGVEVRAAGLTTQLSLRIIAFVGLTGALAIGVVEGLLLTLALLAVAILATAHLHLRSAAPRDTVEPLGEPAPATVAANAHEVVDDADAAADSNAMFADHFIATEFAAARRGRDVALVMFGFRHFDEFAEREGTEAACEALREFGRVLRKLTRRMNVSGRCAWRAGSFLSVLSDADAKAADSFIHRVCDAAVASKVKMPAIDAGIAVYQPHLESPEAFVEAAERALAAARSDFAYAKFTGSAIR